MNKLFATTALAGSAAAIQAMTTMIPEYNPVTHSYGFDIYCMIYNSGGTIEACNNGTPPVQNNESETMSSSGSGAGLTIDDGESEDNAGSAPSGLRFSDLEDDNIEEDEGVLNDMFFHLLIN